MAVGLYIHFPFCVSKCIYCNFNSYANKNDMQIKYFSSLIKEISMYGDKGLEIDTIYLGGGTPSIMFDGCVSTILSEVRKHFNVLDNAEITIEANPNSITNSKLSEWKESGVNRLSIGLQSSNEKILKLIGRPHTRLDYVNVVDMAHSIGFNNINTDMLIGLPRQKLSDVRRTLDLIIKCNCTHVSVYSLILEEDTPIYDMVKSGQLSLPKEEKTLGMYNFAYKYLKEKGFERYEVSNFAQPNCECLHNMHTWQMHEYIGLGAGANGYYNGIRYGNVESIEDYIGAITKNKKPIEFTESISGKEQFEETIMLGLRMKSGVNILDIKTKFGVDLRVQKAGVLRNLMEWGFINIDGDNLYATELGFTVLNKIILELVS